MCVCISQCFSFVFSFFHSYPLFISNNYLFPILFSIFDFFPYISYLFFLFSPPSFTFKSIIIFFFISSPLFFSLLCTLSVVLCTKSSSTSVHFDFPHPSISTKHSSAPNFSVSPWISFNCQCKTAFGKT